MLVTAVNFLPLTSHIVGSNEERMKTCGVIQHTTEISGLHGYQTTVRGILRRPMPLVASKRHTHLWPCNGKVYENYDFTIGTQTAESDVIKL